MNLRFLIRTAGFGQQLAQSKLDRQHEFDAAGTRPYDCDRWPLVRTHYPLDECFPVNSSAPGTFPKPGVDPKLIESKS